jgi:tetratricopeptide (TPR) repeat protein
VSERLTKKQLKEDPLLRTTGETLDFARHHVRVIVGVLALGVLLVAIVVFARNASRRSEDQAAGLLAAARTEIARGALEPAAARLEELTTNMSGTTAGKQGIFLLGDLHFGQGRFEESAAAYRQALDAFGDDPILGPVARRGLAASLESSARYEEASTAYRDLAAETPSPVLRADFLLAAARNEVKAGRTSEARSLYQELAANEENPQVARDAELRLAELGP